MNEPIRVGTYPNSSVNQSKHNSKQYRIYSVNGGATTLCGNGGGMGAKTGLYAVPSDNVGESQTIQKAIPEIVDKKGYLPKMFNAYNRAEITDKSPTLSTGSMVTSSCATTIVEPVKYCDNKNMEHLMRPDGKTPTLTASMGMGGGHVPMVSNETTETKTTDKNPTDKKQVYEVKGGLITIKGKQYPIKLADGHYVIRKLTVKECMRLQTVPGWYEFPVSDSQAYKMLGNGWTIDVIKHLVKHTTSGKVIGKKENYEQTEL